MSTLALARLLGSLVLASIALVTGGCFLAPWSPERPDPRAVSGPPMYAPRCELMRWLEPHEIEPALAMDLVADQRIQITRGHPMGGCALGGNARRDVVDGRGRAWDLDGLYIADASIFPTSLRVNPCYTVYALGRYIAHKIVEDIHA
jgi:choline dehydrogenase-like flavoprotein